MNRSEASPKTMTRRSSRLRVRIPVLVKSLDPATDFSSACVALVVNAHGCAVQTSQPLAAGIPVHIKVRDGGEATARVLDCKPLGQRDVNWIVALELDKPDNIWGLKSPPDDWLRVEAHLAQPDTGQPASASAPTAVHPKMPVWPLATPSGKNGSSAIRTGPEVIQQLAAQAEAIANLKDELADSCRAVADMVQEQISLAQEQMLARAGEQFGARLDAIVHNQEKTIATLQDEFAAELHALSEDVRKQLADEQERTLAQTRKQFNASLAEMMRPLQEEIAHYRDKADESQQIHSVFATQFEHIPEMVDRHARGIFDSLMERARAELQQVVSAAGLGTGGSIRQHDQAAVEALLAQVAKAREALEASVHELPQRIQLPIQAAVEEALADAGEEIARQVVEQMGPLHSQGTLLAGDLRSLVDSLRAERDATSAQIETLRSQREELRQWLAEQENTYTKEMAQRLDRLAEETADRATNAVEDKLRANVAEQAEIAKGNLNERLGPMLREASDFREEAVGLLSTLRMESERCETHLRALRYEKQQLEVWIAQRASDFQKTFHDALVETTGQIKGRLQMAVEMIEQPPARLRDESSRQLQTQAHRHAQELSDQVNEACERLTRVQHEVENSVREALRGQAAEVSAAFGREIAEVAYRSVEQWRSSLADNLAAISNLLGQQLANGKK